MDPNAQRRRRIAEFERTFLCRGRATTGRIAVEGWRVLGRALRAGWRPELLLTGPRFRDGCDGSPEELRSRLADLDPPAVPLTADELRAYVGDRGEGEVLALGPRPSARIPSRPGSGFRWLVAHDIEDPGNAGALARVALASGVDALVATGNTDPFHPRAIRVSRGSVFRLPIVDDADVASVLEAGRGAGGIHLGTSPAAGEALPGVRPDTDRWALWVGSESRGLGAELLDAMDRRIRIPMAGGVDSYSVHAAAAIALYALTGGDPGR